MYNEYNMDFEPDPADPEDAQAQLVDLYLESDREVLDAIAENNDTNMEDVLDEYDTQPE